MADRDAGDLRGRVNAGVGASRRNDRVMFAEDHGELVFDRRLDAVRIGLPLPSGVLGAVVSRG